MRTRTPGLATTPILALLLTVLGLPGPGQAQMPGEVRDELSGQFNASMGKFIALAEAMPPETFTWSPGEGVMEVGHVFMHVARYNYLYPSQNMDMALPEGVDLKAMESVRAKDEVVRALEESRTWVRESIAALSGEDLSRKTRLYGRDVQQWAVLVQLVSHMNQHLGQSIAYARMNGVVPPWSR